MRELKEKQMKFCTEYLIDLNGRQAAIRAGYSARTAEAQASRLLTNVNVQEHLRQLQSEARKQSDISREEVLSELAAMLRAKITDYLHFDGTTIRFKDFDDLTESQVKAIESIKETRHGIELKLHGKSWTVERICRILGYDSAQKFDTRTSLDFASMPEEQIDIILSRIFKIQSDGKS